MKFVPVSVFGGLDCFDEVVLGLVVGSAITRFPCLLSLLVILKWINQSNKPWFLMRAYGHSFSRRTHTLTELYIIQSPLHNGQASLTLPETHPNPYITNIREGIQWLVRSIVGLIFLTGFSQLLIWFGHPARLPDKIPAKRALIHALKPTKQPSGKSRNTWINLIKKTNEIRI